MKQSAFEILESDRLLLRRFSPDDAAAFQAYRSQPLVYRYQGDGWVDMTAEKYAAFVFRQARIRAFTPGTWFQIAVERRSDGRLIGDCGVFRLKDDPRQAEVGFSLDPSCQGQGYGLEMVQCLIRFLFERLDMHRIFAVADVQNERSCRLLTRAGFRQEGHFHQKAWSRGGYVDEYLFARLQDELSET